MIGANPAANAASSQATGGPSAPSDPAAANDAATSIANNNRAAADKKAAEDKPTADASKATADDAGGVEILPNGRAANDPREVRRREREAQLRAEGVISKNDG